MYARRATRVAPRPDRGSGARRRDPLVAVDKFHHLIRMFVKEAGQFRSSCCGEQSFMQCDERIRLRNRNLGHRWIYLRHHIHRFLRAYPICAPPHIFVGVESLGLAAKLAISRFLISVCVRLGFFCNINATTPVMCGADMLVPLLST